MYTGTTAAPVHSAPATAPARAEGVLSMKALRSGLMITAIAATVFSAWVLFGMGGWRYYTTPVATRGYDQAHRLLRPSGPFGQTFGVAGTLLMLMPFVYMVRKRLAALRTAGNLKAWLEVHIFCGVFGPVLITYHTSFKFNGLVSVAYWSMVIVMLSGIIGRYLYVRIPRTIRGHELTQSELEIEARALLDELAWTTSPVLMQRIEQFERIVVPRAGSRVSIVGAFIGGIKVRRELRALTRASKRSGMAPETLHHTLGLIAERADLLRRLAYLEQTKRWFELWHVFHRPLVYVMFAIVVLHIGIALYLGYVPFRW